MTPDAFKRWLAQMRKEGFANTDEECAKSIGISRRTLVRYKEQGAHFTISLACKNAIHKLGPYD